MTLKFKVTEDAHKQKTLYEVLEDLDLENTLPQAIEELPVHHILTSWSSYFKASYDHTKTFDIRRRKKGRVFSESQFLFFREFDRPTGVYTGRWDLYHVRYIVYSEETEAFGVKGGSGVDTMAIIHVIGNHR